MTSGAGAARQVSRETFEAVMQLLSDQPELTPDRLRQLIESSGRRRPRAETVRPRTAGEVVQLLEAKVITRARGAPIHAAEVTGGERGGLGRRVHGPIGSDA